MLVLLEYHSDKLDSNSYERTHFGPRMIQSLKRQFVETRIRRKLDLTRRKCGDLEAYFE